MSLTRQVAHGRVGRTICSTEPRGGFYPTSPCGKNCCLRSRHVFPRCPIHRSSLQSRPSPGQCCQSPQGSTTASIPATREQGSHRPTKLAARCRRQEFSMDGKPTQASPLPGGLLGGPALPPEDTRSHGHKLQEGAWLSPLRTAGFLLLCVRCWPCPCVHIHHIHGACTGRRPSGGEALGRSRRSRASAT